MRRLLLALLAPVAFAQPALDQAPGLTNQAAMLLLAIETIFVIVIAAHLIRFVNITRKNKALVFIYITISLFLFNSVLNLLYFISGLMGWSISYIYLYLIERAIMIVTFVIIMMGFLKFNKILRTKVR